MGRICGVRERAKGDPKACDLSYRDGVTSTAIPTKVLLLPALPTPLWYLRAEAPPVLGSRVGLEAMSVRRRGQSHMPSTVALTLDWGGWGICAFQGSRQIKKVILGFFHKEFLGMGLLPAYRAPPPRTAFQLGSN